MWVPLVENGEAEGDGTDYFIKRHIDHLLAQDRNIDTVFLGCTHYPILEEKIRKCLPEHISMISQGSIVAQSLKEYLNRHPEIDTKCSRSNQRLFFTSETESVFEMSASIFYGKPVQCMRMSFQDDLSPID
jgi:glutamate racemase